mgnify:FL=1
MMRLVCNAGDVFGYRANDFRRTSIGKEVDAQAATFSKTLNHWRKYHFEFTANYERLFNDKHRTTALLYYYMSDEKATKDITDSMSAIPKRYQGVSGRITYSFKILISLMQTSVIQVPKTSSRVSNSVSFLRELSVGYRQTMISCGKRCLGWIFLKSVSRMDK